MKHVEYYETSDGERFCDQDDGQRPHAETNARAHEFALLAAPLFEARRNEIAEALTFTEAKAIMQEIIDTVDKAGAELE